VLASGQSYPLAIEIDDRHIYWTNEGNDGRNGSLVRCEKDGSHKEILESGLDHPAGLELAGDDIYWVSGEDHGEVWQRLKTSGPRVRLATGQNHPWVIVAAGDSIFWANAGTSRKNDGSIMRLVR